MNKQTFPVRYFSHFSPTGTFSKFFFPTIIQQVGGHTDFVQEEQLGLRCFDEDFCHLCRGRRIQMSWHSDFLGSFKSMMLIVLHFWLGCKTVTASAACPAHPGKFSLTSHFFRGRHLWYRPTLLCEYSSGAWVVFNKVTSDYNPAFIFLTFWFQLRILEMTYVLWRSNLNCFLVSSVPPVWPLFCSSLWSFAMLAIFRAFTILSHRCCCIRDVHCLEYGDNFCTRL